MDEWEVVEGYTEYEVYSLNIMLEKEKRNK